MITEVSPGHFVCTYTKEEEAQRQKDLAQYIKDNTQSSYDRAFFNEVAACPDYQDHGRPVTLMDSRNRGTSHNRIS